MKKTILKPLIITAVVLVIAVGLTLLITLLPDSDDAEVSASPTPGETVSTTTYLVNEDYYALEEIKVHFRDTPEEDLSITTYDEDGQRRFRVEPSVPGWNYNHTTLSSAAWNAVSITALATVADSTDDLAYYGLDDPQYVFDISFSGGKSYQLRIGDPTAVDDSFYGMIDDDPAVYAVAKYSVQRLTGTELSYRELDFFDSSVYLDAETGAYDAAYQINYVRLFSESRGINLEFRQRSAEELAGDLPAGATTWRMYAPIESECNDLNVEDSFVDLLLPLTVSSVITDVADDTEMAEYGLDDPIELWLENTEGDSVHYYIGDYNDAGDCYVMVEGCNSILYATGFNPAVLETNYVDLMFKLLWITNISDVERIEYDLGETKHLLNILENYTDDDGNNVFYATLDGRAITSTNARRLFTYALNLLIVGDLKDEFDIQNKQPDYAITIVMKDGTSQTLELYAMNERQYAASVNGEDASFYVNVSNIRALRNAFDYNERGEEIPRA